MSKRNLETGSKGAGGSAPAALGLILLLALPALQPLLRGELSCGFDTTFHLWRAVEAEALLRAGVLLPRWVPHMAYGYGYPLFLFQSPFSAQLAAVLHLVSGAAWPLVLIFTYGLGIVASGWTMWLLAREFWGDRGGILAAVAYIYAPFHAYVAYFRASLSENTAWALLPLLLWGLRRWQQTGERRGLVTAVLTLALLFYTHDVTAYAAFPLIAAWVLAHSLPGRDWAALRRGGLAWGWGFAAAAFFWLPALAERSQIQFARANSAWPFLYENNFLPWSQLFALPHNADPLLMNDWPPRGIGLVLAAAALLGLAAGWRRLPRVRPFLPWLTLALLGYLFLTISWSQPIWDGVPLLAAFQFPWRFLAPATLLAALLAGGGATLLPARPALAPLLLIGLLLPAHWGWFYPQSCPPPDDISLAGMVAWERGTSTLGTTASRELLPVTVSRMPQDTYELPVWEARLATADLPAGVVVETAVHTPRGSKIALTAAEPFTLRYRAFAFPGWQAHVGGERVEITPSQPEGLITFPVPAGRHTIEIGFMRTPLRWAGDLLSLAAVGLLGVVLWRRETGEMAVVEEKRGADGRFYAQAAILGIVLLLLKLLLVDTALLPPRQTALADGVLRGVDQSSTLTLGTTAEPDLVRLLGYETVPAQNAADAPLPVTLYWQAARTLDADYRVGLQLVDDSGRLWSLPGLRDWRWGRNPVPTNGWLPAEYAQTAYYIDLLPGTPPGRYTLQLSLFEKATLTPLTFFADGASRGPYLSLGVVEVTAPRTAWPAEALAPQFPVQGALGGVQLLGANIDRGAAAPGDGVLVTLFWAAEGETAVPLTLALVADGVAAAEWPLTLPAHGAGRWRRQAVLRLPVALADGVYRWQLRDGDGETRRWGELAVAAPERLLQAPEYATPVGETLDGVAELVGVTAPEGAQAGERLPVRLVWRGAGEMTVSYHRFVQLMGEDGRPWAQADGVPASGSRPTTGWLPGEYFIDELIIDLPPDLPNGEYRLITGLYAGDQRLLLPDGTDFIELGVVAVGSD